jgi:peroxiredoxin (alkyl hydroperoxide reductase subunit C)
MELFEYAKVGEPAPHFEMLSTKNLETLEDTVSLEDYRGQWLVLFFYPHDFSIVCPTEILALSDSYEEFKAINAEIIGVSTDSVYSHRAWLQTPQEENGIQGTKFILASDRTHEVAESYGVLVEEKGIALRGLFIIDPEGVLQYAVVHNMDIGRSVNETLRVLEALQAGGLCGANWEPGEDLL